MIPRLSYTNIAIVGLLQIGTIVAGVLAAGAAYKVWSISGLPHDRGVLFASEYGFLFLAVPLIWITVAMVLQGRDNVSDWPEVLTFYSGVLVLVALLIAAWKLAFSPMFRGILGDCGFTLAS